MDVKNRRNRLVHCVMGSRKEIERKNNLDGKRSINIDDHRETFGLLLIDVNFMRLKIEKNRNRVTFSCKELNRRFSDESRRSG
jgi:hypothetical protein